MSGKLNPGNKGGGKLRLLLTLAVLYILFYSFIAISGKS
jgi:hypothetical protein